MASFRFSLLPMPMLLLTALLFLNINKVVDSTSESVSFSFSEFVPQQPNLVFQGDAVVTPTGKLQLTKVQNNIPVYNSVGRTLYATPVHIWDSKTGNVASFTTSFSFIINIPDKSLNADGLSFFLAPVDTQPQKSGGLLGLFPNEDEIKSHQVVAVEFDTFLNVWDPKDHYHIGVNVNSIKSVKTAPWDLVNGEVANVFINYQASTKVLTASLVYPSSQKSYVASSVVDIKNVLPEFVRVGFSSSSGLSENYRESHDVLSWSFESKLPAGTKTCASKNVHLVSSNGPDSRLVLNLSCE